MDVETIVPLGGVALAALLSTVGYLWRIRLEAKKSTKKVLYYLLEIRYAINTSLIDPHYMYDNYIDEMLRELSSREVIVRREDVDILVGAHIRQHMINVAESIAIKIDKSIVVPYESALLDLAEVNPVLAYKLKGKERFQIFLEHSKDYSSRVDLEVIPKLFGDSECVKDALIDFGRSTTRESMTELATSLDDEILIVARNCGWLDYFKAKKALRFRFEQFSLIDTSEMKSFIDDCMQAVHAAIANHQAQNQSDSTSPDK